MNGLDTMSRRTGCLLACLFLAAFWSLVGWGACQAAGAERSSQETSDEIAGWLSSALHAEVQPRVVVETRDLYWPAALAEIHRDEVDRYRILPEIAGMAADGDPRGIYVMVHELLHRSDAMACWDSPGPVNVEEGITDAVAVDLMTPLMWQLHGRRGVRMVPIYDADYHHRAVSQIRAASVFGSGARRWNDWSARSWRFRIWGASCPGRAAMLAAAEREKEVRNGR